MEKLKENHTLQTQESISMGIRYKEKPITVFVIVNIVESRKSINPSKTKINN